MYKFPEHVTPLARDLIGKVRRIKTFSLIGMEYNFAVATFFRFLGARRYWSFHFSSSVLILSTLSTVLKNRVFKL